MTIAQAFAGNLLLRTMPPPDYALLEPHLTRIAMPVRLQLHAAHRPISRVYFPEHGLVSIVAVMLDDKHSEVGLFGREGMSETATVLGTDHSPHEAYVQIAGESTLSLPVEVLTEAFETSSTLRTHLLRYVQAMMIQLSSSIAAASLTIPQRLARWLLMSHDRVDGDVVHLTHEFLGMMLTVRRPGVTTALKELADGGLIATERGSIAIIDRAALRHLAGGGYGLAESEYARLLGEPLSRDVPATLKRAANAGTAQADAR